MAAIAMLAFAAVAFADSRPSAQPVTVYTSDFAHGAEREWSTAVVGRAPADGRALLGPFGSQRVRLSLKDLPEHTCAVVHVDLLVIGRWTGFTGGAAWRAGVVGGPALVETDFATVAGVKQSYPEFAGQGQFEAATGAAEKLDLGYKPAITPATTAASQPAVPGSKDNLYHLTFAVAHRGREVVLEFSACGLDWLQWQRWGLASVRVEIVSGRGGSEDGELAAAWEDLGSTDDAKFGAAMARLVCAAAAPRGASVILADIRERLSKPDDVASPDDRLRQSRCILVLERLGTPAADALLRQLAASAPQFRLRQDAAAAMERSARSRAMSALARSQAAARQHQPTTTATCIAEAALALPGTTTERLADCAVYQEALSDIASIEEAQRRASELEGILRRDPADVPSRNALLMLLMGELDDPSAAARRLTDSVDADVRRAITAAADPHGLTVDDRLSLAAWYRTISRGYGSLGRRNALSRSREAYAQALSAMLPDEARYAATASILARLDAELAALEAERQQWTDLAAGAQLPAGSHWERDGHGALLLKPTAYAAMLLPGAADGSYELCVRFARTEGGHGVYIAMPVAGHRCDLNLAGWGNAISGIELINGKAANANPTGVRGGLVNDHVYALLARVLVKKDQVRITVKLDGRPFLEWQGDIAALGTSGPWINDPHAFAIGAHSSAVTFESVRLRLIGGGPTTRP